MASSSSRFLSKPATIEAPTIHPPTTDYQVIIDGAKYRNINSIYAVLRSVSINLRDTSNRPPISRLAEAGDTESVEFLKKYFNVNESWAAEGYARAVNVDALNNLVLKYPNRMKYLCAEAAYGLGTSKRPDLAIEIINKHPDLIGTLYFYLTMGLGENGDSARINHYLNAVLTEKSLFFVKLHGVAYGLGLGNHESVFMTLLNYQYPSLRTQLLLRFVSGLSVGGHDKTILTLLKLNPDLAFVLIPAIVEGLSRSLKFDSINTIEKLYPIRKKEILQRKLVGLACGGYIEEAEKLLQTQIAAENYKDLRTIMITCYASHYHTSNALAYIKKYPEECLSAVKGFASIGLASEVTDIIIHNLNQSADLTYGAVELYSAVGNFIEADLVIKTFPDYRRNLLMAKLSGMVDGRYLEMANNLFAACKIEFAGDFAFDELFAETLASHGLLNQVIDLLFECPNNDERLALGKLVVSAFINNYYFNEAIAFVGCADGEIDTLFEEMAATIQPLLTDDDETLHLLSTIPSKNFRINLVNAFDELYPMANISRFLPRADKINSVMRQHKLNYQQALGWIKPEIQFWQMRGLLLLNKSCKNEDIFLLIASFLIKSDVEDLKELRIKQNAFFTLQRTPLRDITNLRNGKKITLLTKDRQRYDLRKIR